MKKVGTRLQVYRGKAERTSGGLKKSDLKLNQRKKLVSVKKSNKAKTGANPLKNFLLRSGKRRKKKKAKN